MFGISSSTPVAFTAAFVSFPRAVARGAPCESSKGVFMQDIVHDAHSFATQITAKGACRYTNTTRNPPHRASQNSKRATAALFGTSKAPRSTKGSFLQQIASYKRLDAGDKARGSFRICKPQVTSIRLEVQKVKAPLDAYNSRFAAKRRCSPTEATTPARRHRREGDRGRPYGEKVARGFVRGRPPMAKVARGFARGSRRGADRCLIWPRLWAKRPSRRAEPKTRGRSGSCPGRREGRPRSPLQRLNGLIQEGRTEPPRRRARWGGRGRGR